MKDGPASQRGSRSPGAVPGRKRCEAGLTLLEALVALVLLSAALLALAGAAGASLKTSSESRRNLQVWSAVHRVVDSLTAAGWGAVSDGAAIVNDYPIWWTVTSVTPELDRVDAVVARRRAGGFGAMEDSLTLYLAKPDP